MSTIYLGTIDAGGDGETLLLAAINAAEGTNYTLADWEFGIPEAVTVPSPTHNTKVALGPKAGTGYYGVRSVFYNRIHASQLGNVIVPYAGEMYITQVIDKINEKYGIQIKQSDIYDAVIPAPAPGHNQVQVTLQFRPESIIFYDGVQVQIGQNDPTGDTAPTLPFESYHSFLLNNVQTWQPTGSIASTRVMLEPFSLTVDRDRVRKNVAQVRDASFENNATAHVRDMMTLVAFNTANKYVPFVGMYRDQTTGKMYAVSPLADIYESTSDVTGWHFIGNALGYDTTDPAVVSAGYATPYVKAVTQGADGTAWFLARATNGTPGIYKNNAGHATWAFVPTSTTRMISLKSTAWANLEVLDCLHLNNQMFLLIRSVESYDVHPTKTVLTPSLEIISTNGGGVDYFPLGSTKIQYSNIELAPGLSTNWSIVTPLPGATVVDIVCLAQSSKNSSIYAVFYKHVEGGEYIASILPNSFIGDDGARKELSVAAYQLPLDDITAEVNGVAATGHYLDVVEIGAPTESNNFNPYFLRTLTRTQTKFLSYGAKVLTSVATRTARTPWKETEVPMSDSLRPVQVKIQCQGQRNHVFFQNGTSVHRLAFRQINGTHDFAAELDSSIALDDHTGFANVCSFGAGVYVPPAVIDSPAVVAQLSTDQDFEALFSDINYSFLAKDGTTYRWLTATGSGQALSSRTPSRNYAFMGEYPCLIASEGNDLIYWSPTGNGTFKSSDKGKSWQEFSAAPAYYSQSQVTSAVLNLLGRANLALKPEHFYESALAGGILLAEVKASINANVYDINAKNTNTSVAFNDHALFRITTGGMGMNAVESADLSSYGLNVMGALSPRKIYGWDSDATSNLETIGAYTVNWATPYDMKYNQDNYLFNVSGTLLDFSRDTRYLGFRHWILVNDGGVIKLHFTNTVMPEYTIGMFGSDNVSLSTFTPEVNFHLWDYLDAGAGYIPYVFYGNKKVVLLERATAPGVFNNTLHVLNVPDDNGQPLVPVRMRNANRRDYCFAQKGNGIFRLVYTWDGITETSTVVLQKIFSLTTASLNTLEIISGTQVGIAAANAPQEATLPDRLPNGTFIGFWCNGTTKMSRYADGNGGYYETPTADSTDCGFVVSLQGGQGGGGAGGGA